MLDQDKEILRIWDEAEEDFPDKSTEWLMQYTCDMYVGQFGKEIDHGDVAVALSTRNVG